MNNAHAPTIGSLFAGIGGFDIGFEQAGWCTSWQVEINPVNRAVLADRFPHARQFEDVRECGKRNLSRVDCITAGFPCQDISNAGSARKGGNRGLNGARSGLFFEVLRILDEIRPEWVVLENVPALLSERHIEDFQIVVGSLASRGYLGCARVLDAHFFGVPQRRERLYMVGRLGAEPPFELLADAAPVERLPSALTSRGELWCEADRWPGYTLLAKDVSSRISLGSELLVAHEDGWGAMAERERITELHGLCVGLDEANTAEAFAAGNAVCPQVAEWVARKILRAING